MEPAALRVMLDTFWVLLTGFLVFFMNLGFAMVESGLCRVKNTVNILAKNFVVFAVSSLAYYFLGFGLMYGDGNALFGTQGLLAVVGQDNSPAAGQAYRGAYSALSWTGVPLWAKFFFQLVFCGTAATIVSGAVAERIRFASFIVFSFLICTLIYPVAGHWIWGGGWLAQLGMFDFAGSTVVATLGVFVLWFGWFGFNPGSTMALNAPAIAHIAVVTNMSAAAAAATATLASWLLAVMGFDRLRIDDPVGALSVHLCNGLFGTLAVGLFAEKRIAAAIGTDAAGLADGLFFGGGFRQLGAQALGAAAVAGFVFSVSLALWALIRAVMGLRVSRAEEIMGLDIGEHGMEAYSGFQTFTNT